MNQTRQKGKKTNFGPGSDTNLSPELFLWQFDGKLMNQT